MTKRKPKTHQAPSLHMGSSIHIFMYVPHTPPSNLRAFASREFFKPRSPGGYDFTIRICHTAISRPDPDGFFVWSKVVISDGVLYAVRWIGCWPFLFL